MKVSDLTYFFLIQASPELEVQESFLDGQIGLGESVPQKYSVIFKLYLGWPPAQDWFFACFIDRPELRTGFLFKVRL